MFDTLHLLNGPKYLVKLSGMGKSGTKIVTGWPFMRSDYIKNMGPCNIVFLKTPYLINLVPEKWYLVLSSKKLATLKQAKT